MNLNILKIVIENIADDSSSFDDESNNANLVAVIGNFSKNYVFFINLDTFNYMYMLDIYN